LESLNLPSHFQVQFGFEVTTGDVTTGVGTTGEVTTGEETTGGKMIFLFSVELIKKFIVPCNQPLFQLSPQHQQQLQRHQVHHQEC
jgi:hypothetical protein